VCRVLAYLGDPVPLDGPLFAADNSLIAQSVGARLMSLLNIGGFGLAAWEARSPDPQRPYLYRTTGVPVFDRNLKALAEKVHATSAIAHVRGHPFRFRDARVVLAQNGDLHGFGQMKYDLLEHVAPELASCIEGTTDTEWIYALLLSQLADPFGPATAEELVEATEAALLILRGLRERRGVCTQSPVNLVIGDGDCLVATRFCFDYGWYPDDGSFFAGEREFDFTSMWYTLGEQYVDDDGRWGMRFGDGVGAALIASEPLGEDTTGWIEAPEYSMLIATRDGRRVDVVIRELDL
jgi:glutamine amidotransferase